MQWGSYEKRIEELERRLSNRYSLEHKIDKDESFTSGKVGDSKSETSSERDVQGHSGQFSEPMDDASYGYSSSVSKSGVDKTSKILDDNMTDSSGMANPNPNLDSSMREPSHDVNEKEGNEETGPDVGMQNNLEEKSNQLIELETKLEAAKGEVASLSRDLENSRNQLDESQVNCVHQIITQTHLCAANSKASDYNKLRGSTLKIRSLFERLKSSVSKADASFFADSLQSLAQSLTNSANDNEDDGTSEFRECVHMLAKKVGRYRAELVDRYTKAEVAQQQLTKELDESKALVNTLYLKHQSEKQANKEIISIGRLELHEIAAFVLDAAGYYTAINRNCSHYYLSPESAALYADSATHNPTCIVGQIVHIERQTVKPLASGVISGPTDANPYGLAVGCEFFVVTVATLPDTAVHPPPPAAAS